MLLEFLGAAHEVTGSCHFLQCQDKRILVDCGMEQGPDLYVNQEIPVNASNIDYVFVTHAHIDHSGLLPLLYSHGFRGQIFATTATSELCNIMLKDSAHIQMFEAEWRNRKARRAGLPEVVPLYDMDDAQGVLEHFVACDYNKIIEICVICNPVIFQFFPFPEKTFFPFVTNRNDLCVFCCLAILDHGTATSDP